MVQKLLFQYGKLYTRPIKPIYFFYVHIVMFQIPGWTKQNIIILWHFFKIAMKHHNIFLLIGYYVLR